MIAAGLDPITQFEIHKLLELSIGKYDISFTNSSLMMVVAVLSISLWLLLSSKKSLVPGRAQSIAEISYEFVADMVKSAAGKEGLKFFPFVFTLFIFILFANLLGMIPFYFYKILTVCISFFEKNGEKTTMVPKKFLLNRKN